MCDVPQWSVLGPLLFLVYLHDICNSSNLLDFFLFANDTNLLSADRSVKNLEITVNKELAKVSDWLIASKLTLNIKKSNFVIFRPRQKKLTLQPTMKLFDNNSQHLVTLDCKNYVKYLGVLIDDHLSWKYHIDHIATKISKTVGIIARLRHFVPFSILRGCLPKSGTVVVGLKLHFFSFFNAMKGIHVQVTKWVSVCENNLKYESTQRFKFWLSRYPGRPGSRGGFGPTLKSRY